MKTDIRFLRRQEDWIDDFRRRAEMYDSRTIRFSGGSECTDPEPLGGGSLLFLINKNK